MDGPARDLLHDEAVKKAVPGALAPLHFPPSHFRTKRTAMQVIHDDPGALRHACRAGGFDRPTAGHAPGASRPT